ncbi:50S ribosomal protein L10 [Candidatus Pacearchaeota archaeon]|nr:50S ribosomal protein L10 [Candidatus Pacearchaeota archaeon]|tara:strand:+ start:9 stop:950 length:942 start_codon:yes stop_codon:yes gene_type:complete
MTPKKQVPKYKIEAVNEFADLIKNKKTILIASIKNIPGSQFQEISKKLRGKAIIKVPKKNLINRAIESSDKGGVKKLGSKIDESFAILFSDLDSYELAGELLRNTSPAKAKSGQEAPEDIEIESGPTELVPGPAISELGALGIQIQIEKGKIHIKQSKIIAKKGEKISQGAANLMSKLDVKPFKIGFIPICALDTQENKYYENINIDSEKAVTDLKEAHSKALPFAVAIGYATEDTIKFLLAKAVAHEKALEKFAEANAPIEEGTNKKETQNSGDEQSKQKIPDESLTTNENPEPQSREANSQSDKSDEGEKN